MKRTLILCGALAVLLSGCGLFEKGNEVKMNPVVTFPAKSPEPAEPMTTPVMTPEAKVQKTVTLYFADPGAEKVVAEKRMVEAQAGEAMEKVVMEELLKGPGEGGAEAVIPQGTKLLAVETKNGLCTVNLSEEFIKNNQLGSAGELMIIYSIVNSITEVSGVSKVQFLIEGQKREAYVHMGLDEPFERNESLIVKDE